MGISWNKPKIAALLKENGRAGMNYAGAWLEGFTKKSFLDMQGSPEGGPPGVVTGSLRRSVTHKPNDTADEVSEKIGANMEYARRLELGFAGTDKAGRNINQGPRPSLRPAVYDHKVEILKAYIQGAKKGTG